MKKEVVVFIDDGNIYQVDVAAVEKCVEKHKINYSSRDYRFITFQPDLLIRLLEDITYHCEIIDFECLDKQIRQSVGLAMHDGKWNIPNMLSTYLNVEERNWEYEDYSELLKLLADCYSKMKEIGQDEWDRIEKIEIPVNKILYGAQLRGCYFKNEDLEPLCSELHRNIYGYKNEIQLNLGFTGSDLESYLRKMSIKHNTLEDSEIKRLCKEHPELEPFRKIRKEQRNLNCLLLLSAIRHDSNICTPLFKGFGSTTGRIIMKEPAIQNLNSKYRYLLKNESLPFGYRYVYVDYGQFEAGILAGLTDNPKLKLLYEKDKVYEELRRMSKFEDRDTAKTAFYCFVYGGIIWKGAESFFSKYGLKDIIDQVVEKAKETGFVNTLFGNRRVVKDEDDEKWIMNHYIQGTSSLIFKQALIDVYNQFHNNAVLLIPMHDAALYMVDSSVDTNSIINTFKKAFTKWIPNCKPIVKEKNFFEE